MNNIVNVAQISLAVIQYAVAAAVVGAVTFSAWTTKKSKLLTVAAVIAVLGLNSQAFAFANSHPAFRPGVESLVDSYFDLIDEIATELESHRMSGNGKIWII